MQQELDHLDILIRLSRKEEQLKDPYALHDLCLRQEIDLLVELLASRRHQAHVNGCNQNGLVPLHVAVVSAQPPYLEDLLNYLLYYDADPNARCTPDGNTGLHLAVIYSKLVNAEISVPLLLKAGATPNLQNYAGRTPKDYALSKGYLDLAALLDAIEKDPARRHEIDIYNWKAKFGVEKRPDEELLQVAIERGDAQAVADVAHRMNSGAEHKTDGLLCYHMAVEAARQNKARVIDSLAEAGANASEVDEEGNSPIQLAILSLPHNPEMLQVIKALLKAGVPKTTSNKDNKTALELATELGYNDVVELLKDPKPQPPADQPQTAPPPLRGGQTVHEILNAKGLTMKQRLQQLQQLWDRDPRTNPNGKSNDGAEDTPLHVTVRYDFEDLTDFLLSKNAIVNVRNKRGETPILLAESTDFGYSSRVLEKLRQANRRQLGQRRWNQLGARLAASSTAGGEPV